MHERPNWQLNTLNESPAGTNRLLTSASSSEIRGNYQTIQSIRQTDEKVISLHLF